MGLWVIMSKKRAELSSQEKINQMVYELRLREEQVKSLNDNLRLISLQLDELNKTIETLNQVKTLEAGEDILVPLGAGVYMKTKAETTSTLTLELGARILAERKPDEISKLLEEKKKETEEARNMLEQQLGSTVQRAQIVQKELEELLQQARSGASPVVPKV